MIKNIHILPTLFTQKVQGIYAQALRLVSHKKLKTILGSNIAFAIIATSSIQGNLSLPQEANLIIPETTLQTSFNIPSDKAVNLETTKTIQIPVEYIYLSQGFRAFHPAIDLASKFGKDVFPIMPGIVTEAGYSPLGYGNMVIIEHTNGMQSLYAHLSKIKVKKGDSVNFDSVIGLIGTTGHSTGPHLHLEIRKDGKSLNPLTVLPTINQKPILNSKVTANLTSTQH